MIAAGAKMAADAAVKTAEKTADVAGSPVDDHEEHYGKDSTHE
jgi:type IV secretion system protein TrbL